MTLIEAIILGLVQGLTEFIPISSSGHLVLLHHAFGVVEAGLAFDVALHIGTLFALLVFFYRDLISLAFGLLGRNDQRRLAVLLLVATIPAVITGVLLESAAESTFRSVRLVSINLILVAFVMLGAEWYAARQKRKTSLRHISKKQALLMGVAQAAAVVPGISRSGATITAGVFSGMDRVAATRFSFLLAVPITFGAVLKVLTGEAALHSVQGDGALFAAGIISAFISGLVAIKFLINYLSKHTLKAFAYYRIALGVLALLLLSVR